MRIKTEKTRLGNHIISQQMYGEPLLPWNKRKLELMRKVYHDHGGKGMVVNRKRCLILNSGSPEANDALRLIKEGWAKLSLQPEGSARSSYRYLQLTPKGVEYMLQHS